MLRAQAVTKDYATQVLHGIDVEIPAGQFVAIMGPSGSGKSTLMHILGGLDRPTGGTVTLDGTDLGGLDETELAELRLRTVGFVFQQPHLLRSLDLLDNVALPGRMAGRPREEVAARAAALLDRMGVADVAHHYPSEASGGQLQRVGICRALMNEPAIVFGDEPTGALNSATAAEVLDLLTAINRDGTTLVVVTHDPHVAARADRVLLLTDGRISADVPLGERDTDHAERLTTVTDLLTAWAV